MNSGDLKIDRTWALFLDRDGVINKRIPGDYVRSWDQFEFLPGVQEALSILRGKFGWIFVVSNQQGVGKGLMSDEDVHAIHARMKEEVEHAGGVINKIYFSPFLEKDHSIFRKPNVGMALKARKEFPGVNFKNSVMVGDSLSDMLFGKRLKMRTVMVSDDLNMIRKGAHLVDFASGDLLQFARSLSQVSSSPSPNN